MSPAKPAKVVPAGSITALGRTNLTEQFHDVAVGREGVGTPALCAARSVQCWMLCVPDASNCSSEGKQLRQKPGIG